MITKVISAFPGTGKTYFASNVRRDTKVVDLDTGDYTQGYTDDGKVRNPNFPYNYLLAVKERVGKSDVLFVGCQPEVIASLRKEGIPFTLVYPERGLKTEYVDRFRQRHSPKSFIDILSGNWDLFLEFLEKQNDCECIVLSSRQYISDVIIAD